MGDVARGLARGSEFTFRGQVYKMSGWTYGVQAEYEMHLEGLAWHTARRLARTLRPEESAAFLSEVSESIAMGKYSFGGRAFSDSLQSVANMKVLWLLQFQAAGTEVSKELVDEMYLEMEEELVAASRRANADPTTPAAGGPEA